MIRDAKNENLDTFHGILSTDEARICGMLAVDAISRVRSLHALGTLPIAPPERFSAAFEIPEPPTGSLNSPFSRTKHALFCQDPREIPSTTNCIRNFNRFQIFLTKDVIILLFGSAFKRPIIFFASVF